MARSRKRRAKVSLLDQLAAERAERKSAALAQRQEQERGIYAADLRKRAEELLHVEEIIERSLTAAKELQELATRYRSVTADVTSVGSAIRQALWRFVRSEERHLERDRGALGDQVGVLITPLELRNLFDHGQTQPDLTDVLAMRAAQIREAARAFLVQTRPETPDHEMEKTA